MKSMWTIYVDGSKHVLGEGAGIILVSLQGDKMCYVLHMRFANPSNNEAEYEVVLLMACRCPPSWEPQEEVMMSTPTSLSSI
jgi:hypothetical protein